MSATHSYTTTLAADLLALAERLPRPYEEDRFYPQREQDRLNADIAIVTAAARELDRLAGREPESRPAEVCRKEAQKWEDHAHQAGQRDHHNTQREYSIRAETCRAMAAAIEIDARLCATNGIGNG